MIKGGIYDCKLIEVETPKFLNIDKKIYIDECILKVMEHLWENKIITLSCCCGHGKFKPSIVVSDSYSRKDIIKIHKLIAEIDDRDFEIGKWELKFYNKEGLI